MKRLIPIETLRTLLTYDSEAGRLSWKCREGEWFSSDRDCSAWNARFAGTEAFCSMTTWGYSHGRVLGTFYRAHRVAWAMFYGKWPNGEIDHINGTKTDNRISNLRLATSSENACNRGIRADNTSGMKGVSLDKSSGKWRAGIRIHGKQISLGSFDDVQSAAKAYDNAALSAHGNFASLNGAA